MKIARINENGMEQIRLVLEMHHHLRQDGFTREMLEAWAIKAQMNFHVTRECVFEIPSYLSFTGYAVSVEINDDGYDVEEVNDV